MLYYFIFVMMPIRAAKQRRSESRRNEVTEREHGGAGGAGGSVYDDGSGDKHNLIVPSDAT